MGRSDRPTMAGYFPWNTERRFLKFEEATFCISKDLDFLYSREVSFLCFVDFAFHKAKEMANLNGSIPSIHHSSFSFHFMKKQPIKKSIDMTSTSRLDVEVMPIIFLVGCFYIKRGALKVDHHGQHVVVHQFEDRIKIESQKWHVASTSCSLIYYWVT